MGCGWRARITRRTWARAEAPRRMVPGGRRGRSASGGRHPRHRRRAGDDRRRFRRADPRLDRYRPRQDAGPPGRAVPAYGRVLCRRRARSGRQCGDRAAGESGVDHERSGEGLARPDRRARDSRCRPGSGVVLRGGGDDAGRGVRAAGPLWPNPRGCAAGPAAADAGDESRDVHGDPEAVAHGRNRGGRRPRFATRRRARGDRAAAASGDVRPVGHRRALDGSAP